MLNSQISLNPHSIFRVLGVVAFLLVLASVGLQLIVYLTGHDTVFGLVRLFYVDREQNIPTSYSTFLLLFASFLLAVITVLERKRSAVRLSYWATLSIGFLYLAADEAASIHEMLVRPVRNLLGGGNLGIFHFAWVLPGIILVLLLALFYARFLRQLSTKPRLTFMLAGTLYVGGAIGVEMIGGWYTGLHGRENLTYSLIATVEESLEMIGTIVFIWALLEYIADNYNKVVFRLEDVAENSRSKTPKTSTDS